MNVKTDGGKKNWGVTFMGKKDKWEKKSEKKTSGKKVGKKRNEWSIMNRSELDE